MQSAVQLYTVRAIDEPYLDLLDRVGETSFDGVEFAKRADEADSSDVRERLEAHGLEAVSAHVGIEALEDDFDATIAQAKALGYEHLVIPWIGPEHWETVAAVERTAERLSALVEAVAAEGLTLHYHNHDHEFVDTEQGTAFHLVAELVPALQFEIDAGWALAGGEDPAALIRHYGDRVTIVHMKDVVEGTSATDDLDPASIPALGEGDLDLEAVAEAARDVDAEWLVYEDDEPAEPETALDHGASILDRYV